jgi:ABC-2 type transport system permease protein
LPSRRSPFGWLLNKDWHELMSSRAWWAMLVLTGPLVGVSFISAVRTYGEASGLNGTTEGVGEAFSPLVGVWAPMFSAFELIAAFFFPFVVIKLVGGDRQSGALKLELQRALPRYAGIGAKFAVLAAAWLITMSAAVMGLLLWTSYGGSSYAPEIATVALGHFLNGCLTIALGAAAASIAEHPSTAAILTLAFTVSAWVISFIAAIHGGLWERVGSYTPPALVAQFQSGLIRLDVVLSTIVLTIGGLAIAAIWRHTGVRVFRRLQASAMTGLAVAAAIALCLLIRPSWDASENRQNSFPEADQAALRQIHQRLQIEAHFAPEDARRGELERRALSKLRRVMPDLEVKYVSRTSIGVFEQNTDHYGEIVYTLGSRQDTSRIVTAEGVLETIYGLANVRPAAESDDDIFRGHPLAVPPRHAGLVFYGLWPAATAGVGLFLMRRPS